MSRGPGSHRERLAFWASLVGLYALFVVQAVNTPVLLDDWYQLPYWRQHDFSLAAIWEYGYYNYFHFNPRIGDVFLLVVNSPTPAHLILTPLVEVGVLVIAFVIAFARWPRPTYRDLWLLLFLQVMIWIVIPIPGIIYFYRPFATNYLWAFGITLSLFVPYRLALARPTPPPRRLWAIPLMLVLGWIAGMCNEHTGPTAMVAIAILVVVFYKRRQLRAWMVAGALGLYIGYPMLFFAPGQALRYAGMATRNTPVNVLRERGLDGCFEILLEFIAEAQNGIIVFLVIVLLYIGVFRRRGEPVPAVPRVTILTAALFMIAAGSIIVTLFASPTATERLFFAPALLLVCAFGVFVEQLLDEPAVRRVVVTAFVAIFAYHGVRFVAVYVAAKHDNDERIAKLTAAPDNAVVEVEPYATHRRNRWYWGDDFRYASLREYVANEVFDLNGIVFDRHLRWAEPIAPDRYVAIRTYEPPLSVAEAAKVAPVRYIPTYWEWAIAQTRRLLATTDLANHAGHKLVRYDVMAEGTAFADPLQRPIYVVRWTPTHGFEFIDGRPDDDELGRPYIRVWQDSVPKQWTESYVVDCGKTRKVEAVPDKRDHVGPMLPIALECKGVHTAFMCEPDKCWLAGRYWR
ncbi:MAG TPA: DUF6056 family protein [Kofleriaceae bacterium]|nr:DUF6056 family protein [Kofleriaceae bacterium]